jgi:hypothetical protein
MSEKTPAPMPTADARAALDALLGRRVRATVTRPAGSSVQVITGTLIHDAVYAARDATVRYPAADVHVDDRNLVGVEEVDDPADAATIRDRIAKGISRYAAGPHHRGAVDAAMTEVAPVLAARDAAQARAARYRAESEQAWEVVVRCGHARSAAESQLAAVRSVLNVWEHRTHHGDSGPMDLLRDLQAVVSDRPATTKETPTDA